jgi:hypothetical protein
VAKSNAQPSSDRASDERRITTLLYMRHPEHEEEWAMYTALPPEEQKRAVRMGIRLAHRLKTAPPEVQAYVLGLLSSAQAPPARSTSTPASPIRPKPAVDSPGKFDLFALEE